MNEDSAAETPISVVSPAPLPQGEIWLHRHSASIQAGCALAGFVIAIVTLIFLIRYANDTRDLTRLSQQQFAESQIENKAHRLLDYQRMLNEDNAEMPDLTISPNIVPPTEEMRPDIYVFLTTFNAGSGDASSYGVFDETAKQWVYGGLSVKAHASATISVPKTKWVEGHVMQMLYITPHGSVRQQNLVFTGQSFKVLSDGIARPYQFLVQNGDYTTFAPGEGKNQGVIFGIGPPPGAKLPTDENSVPSK